MQSSPVSAALSPNGQEGNPLNTTLSTSLSSSLAFSPAPSSASTPLSASTSNENDEKKSSSSSSTRQINFLALSQDEKENLQQHKKFGDDIVVVKNLCKSFSLPGRDELVHALRKVNLSHDSDIYPIRQVVILWSPSSLI
jgi:hypothetical protein